MAILSITDEKWKRLSTFFEEPKMGRPRKWNDRQILEALVYILHAGCSWRKLSKEYPPYQTVHRRLQQMEKRGQLAKIKDILLENEQEVSTAFVDGTFVRAMCGGDQIGLTKMGKGSKIMAIVDQNSRPLATIVASARHHEIILLQKTIENLPASLRINKIVGDKAYDSDPHDALLAAQGIELVAPHRKNRKRGKVQDGQALKKRWVVERFLAWMKSAKRLRSRAERKSSLFRAFLDLFSILVMLKEIC